MMHKRNTVLLCGHLGCHRRRDGFGAGRAGRGVGRTNARTNVWQRIDARNQQRNNQDLDPRQETRSGHGNSGFEEEDGERRERGFGDSRGNQSGDGSASSAWERAAGKKNSF